MSKAQCRELQLMGDEPGLMAYRAMLLFAHHSRKDVAKLKAEDPAHLQTYVEVIKEIEHRNPGICEDPVRLWSLDETAVLT